MKQKKLKITYCIIILVFIILFLNACTKEKKIEENENIKETLSYLENTSKIEYKHCNTNEPQKRVEDKEIINGILEIIYQGRKATFGDTIDFTTCSIVMNMLDNDNNIIEEIKVFLSSTPFINIKNQNYYVDTEKIIGLLINS